MLVLVFIFMAPTVIDVDLRQPVVDLPKVEHPIPMWKANREDAIVFVVQRNGDLYFGNQILPQVDDVPFIITKAVHNGAEKKKRRSIFAQMLMPSTPASMSYWRVFILQVSKMLPFWQTKGNRFDRLGSQ